MGSVIKEENLVGNKGANLNKDFLAENKADVMNLISNKLKERIGNFENGLM